LNCKDNLFYKEIGMVFVISKRKQLLLLKIKYKKMKNISMLFFALIMVSCSNKTINKNENSKEVITKMDSKNLFKTKWKLIELRGNKMENTKFTLEFFEENQFSAFAGCNNLGGNYKVENTFKITFSKVISTRMACEDMKTEQEFSKVLEMTDNFILDGKILSLNKGKMTSLARFELIK
jgi:heat shock protein HslJ